MSYLPTHWIKSPTDPSLNHSLTIKKPSSFFIFNSLSALPTMTSLENSQILAFIQLQSSPSPQVEMDFSNLLILYFSSSLLLSQRKTEEAGNVLLADSDLASVLSGLRVCSKLSLLCTSVDSLKIALPRVSDYSSLDAGIAFFWLAIYYTFLRFCK